MSSAFTAAAERAEICRGLAGDQPSLIDDNAEAAIAVAKRQPAAFEQRWQMPAGVGIGAAKPAADHTFKKFALAREGRCRIQKWSLVV